MKRDNHQKKGKERGGWGGGGWGRRRSIIYFREMASLADCRVVAMEAAALDKTPPLVMLDSSEPCECG